MPALAALLWLALATPAALAQAQPTAVLEALAADDTGLGRFPADSSLHTVSLPDDWARSRPLASTPLWYRLRFDAADSSSLLGLYLERACANVEVQLNGQQLHAVGRMSDPISLDCQRPLLLPLPAALLQAGSNTLDLRLSGYALRQVASHQRAGALAAPLIGPYAALAPREARDRMLAVTLPTVASGLLLLTALLTLVMARSRKRDSHLFFFAGLAAGWALVTARLWWHELPLSNFDSELLLACLPPLVALAAVQFLLHYAGWRSRPIEVALYAQCVAVPGSLLLAGPLRVHMTASSWYVLLVLQVLTAIVFYLWTTWRIRRRDFWAMAVLLGVAAVVVGLELATQQIGLPPAWQHLPQLLMPLALVAMGLHLVQQHATEPLGGEAGRAALGDRAREAGAAMEKSYAEMVELRVEQVTRQERKRIAADLHDDLGAKLLTIVHTSDSERISTLAREALEEMRLSVRGLTGKPVQLVDALGDWRAEVVGALVAGRCRERVERSQRGVAAILVGARLRADHAHPARGGQQHHQAQRRVALHGALSGQRWRLPARDPGQRQGHSDRARRPARPRPRHGQHEAPRQAAAGSVPGRVRPRLRNRDPSHASARAATQPGLTRC